MSTEHRVRKPAAVVIGCCLCLALPAGANSFQATQAQSSNILATEQSVTERIDSQSFRADRWGLDESEWRRYQSLMQGIRGSVSPATLSPIEVLGIHARSAGERRHYAERWAAMMRADAERILMFQRAYDDAQRRLFPNSLLIDTHALASAASTRRQTEQMTWQAEDRVLFFTATQCVPCDAVLERLLGRIAQFAGIDLYLIDVPAGEESRIRDWAASKKIDPQWVSEHRITLNIDAGALQQVAGHTGQQKRDLPILILRRGDRLIPLSPSRF